MTPEEGKAHLEAEIARLEEEKPRGYLIQIEEYRKAIRMMEGLMDLYRSWTYSRRLYYESR